MASVTTGLIEKVKIDTGNELSIASTAYGVCDTAADTAAKVVEITGFELVEGVTIHVKFTYSNNAENPTLQVKYGSGDNDITDAKYIVLYGTTKASISAATTGWQQNAVVSLTYDGNYWVRDQGYNTNSTYSALTVAAAWTGTATTGRTITAAGLKGILANLGGTGLTLVHNATDGIVLNHDGGDGNLHVPATGTTNNGNFLKAGATAGSIDWATLVKADISDFAHAHGNISDTGCLGVTSAWSLGDGDGLAIYDASNSNKLEKSGIVFDGVTETKGLTPRGTWVNYAGGTLVTLNGTVKGATTASFYAPTSAGSLKQLLVSTGGAPDWLTDTVGDRYTPTYVSQGVLMTTSVTQKKSFTISANSTGVTLTDNAFNSNTYVLEIVVTSGEAGLHGPIEWESFDADNTAVPPITNSIKLTTATTSENVVGYIITARGETL